MNAEAPRALDHGKGYIITTGVFEGPLNLLLQLIEHEELDITKLALVQVTKPFLEYMQQLQDLHAEEVSNFLVLAARLMQIKSEALLPRPPEREPGEEDPGEALVQQLLLYKRYKEIANVLEERTALGLRTYLRIAPPVKVETKVMLEDLDILNLFKAAKEVFELHEKNKPSGTVVRAPRITVREKIKFIKETLILEGKSTFKNLLGDSYSNMDIVITFLALLELVKQYRVQVTQETLFSDIQIEPADRWDATVDFDVEFSE
jgi:segregation and condensation protein A